MLNLMHIPKSGGVALSHALHGYMQRMGHKSNLEALPLWPPIVTILRDPVERWVSAWDMTQQQRCPPEYGKWPSASDCALDPGALEWLEGYWGQLFVPATWWLRDADYARSRLWYICHTETLDEDWRTIRDAIGAVDCAMPPVGNGHRNAQPGTKSLLTPEAVAAVRAYYADDYELLEGL